MPPRSLNLSSPLTILFWLSFLISKEQIHISREGITKIQPAILNKWTNHINELGISLADLKCWSTTLDPSHLDWLMVKCQFLPKWASWISSTSSIETKGWGPFVEMKLSISVVFCRTGLFLVEMFFRLETSTSTIASLNERFKNSIAKALNFLQFL